MRPGVSPQRGKLRAKAHTQEYLSPRTLSKRIDTSCSLNRPIALPLGSVPMATWPYLPRLDELVLED